MTSAIMFYKVCTDSNEAKSQAKPATKNDNGLSFAALVEERRNRQTSKPENISDYDINSPQVDAAFADDRRDAIIESAPESMFAPAPPGARDLPVDPTLEMQADSFLERSVFGRFHATTTDIQATLIGGAAPAGDFETTSSADANARTYPIQRPGLTLPGLSTATTIEGPPKSPAPRPARAKPASASPDSASGARSSASTQACDSSRAPDEALSPARLAKSIDRVTSQVAARHQSSSVFVALQAFEAGVRVIARVGEMQADERAKLRHAVSAILAEHGLADGGLIFPDEDPIPFYLDREAQ